MFTTTEYIKSEEVYELRYMWLEVDFCLIIGFEDTLAEYGTSSYAEADYRLRLELGKRDKLIVVSRASPHGVLDRAIGYGEKSVDSRTLREFIEEEFDKIVLVVCEHAHRCCGMCERVGDVTAVNTSLHDDHYSRANIVKEATITIGAGFQRSE